MIRRLLLALSTISCLLWNPIAFGQSSLDSITVVYWGSKDCRWCTYWESSASGFEAEFRASRIFPNITYAVVKNRWLKDPYVESDFPSDQRWLWNLAEINSFRIPRIRPTWSIFVGEKHVRSYIGTKAWKESALRAIQRLVADRNQSPELLAQSVSEISPTRKVALTNIDALPYLDNQGKEAYRAWLGRPVPKAFALSLDGAWGRGKSPEDALAYCKRYAEEPCELYAVDAEIVWRNSAEN